VAWAPGELAGFDHLLDGLLEFARGFVGQAQLFGDHRRLDRLVIGVVDVIENGGAETWHFEDALNGNSR
jgi:hypothetical protein